jgi:exosortase A
MATEIELPPKSKIGAPVTIETKARTQRAAPSRAEVLLGDADIQSIPQVTAFSPSWQVAWISFGVGCLAILLLFWSTTVTLATLYVENATYNHGFLIFPIVGYLIWLRRDSLKRLQPRPWPPALILIAIGGLGWLAGNAAGVDMVEEAAMLGIFWSLFLAIFGWHVVRLLLFPLFYAIFAVPFGDNLVPPLQDITAFMAVKGIELVNIPVFSDGLMISIPPGNFEVAEACAGLRFLIATVALGFLFSYLTYKSLWRRVAFIALCLVVPIIANGIRAWGIVFIGYESDMQAAVGFDHIIYGWIFFAIVTAILLAIGMAFRDREVGELPPPNVAWDTRAPVSHTYIVSLALAAIILVGVAPVYAARVIDQPPGTGPIALTAPEGRNGWQLLSAYRDDWTPEYPTADATMIRTYVKAGHAVHLYVAYFRSQREGHEVVNYNNRVYDGKTWVRVGSSSATVNLEGQPMNIESTRILHGRAGRLVWSWQWVSGSFTADPYRSKLLTARAKVLGGVKAAAAVAITTGYGESPAEAPPVLQDFLDSMSPFKPLLARAAGG